WPIRLPAHSPATTKSSRTSSGSSSRTPPGARRPSRTGPTRTRTSRTTGSPTASSRRRTSRLRPSAMTTVTAPRPALSPATPAVGVADGGHHAGRLVEREVPERGVERDPVPVHLHDVPRRDDPVAEGRLPAVHRHAPLSNEVLAGASRRDPRPRHGLLEPF